MSFPVKPEWCLPVYDIVHAKDLDQVTDAQTTAQKPLPPLDPRVPGTIKWFDAKKGFGFIARDGDKDVFFHSTDAKKSGIEEDLEEGEAVTFVLAPTPRGFKAVHIRRGQ